MDDIHSFIRSCLVGDDVAWQQVRSIALKFLRQRKNSQADDHDDIVNEVCIKLLQGFRHFDGTTGNELHRYINVITMREAVSYYRRNTRHQSHDSFDQPLNDDSDSTRHDLLPDDRLNPETVARINDLYRRAGEMLSLRDRQILLYKIEGFTDHEIAELLGMTTGGVAVTYNRIKALLRTTLLLVLFTILSGRKLPWITSL